jgi:hypothetical protein
MIAKGTTHNDGARLAAYMTTGKENERAELWQLRGFGMGNIADAFRCVHAMAEATKAEQPFFHVQVRNREGERLSRQQWEHAADRIERMLGLADQPRAIAFHIDERTGDEHMHVAWSRIDENTMKAVPLPFFKDRLKKISRELELHFGLEPVTNHREGHIKFAPTRAEHEQARRLGLDVHEVRNAIRELWDRSDSGRSFQAALEHEGFILAKGERRDFVVIDQAGGMHPLGKRMLDVTASKIRDRLSDISRDELPSVEVARVLMPEPVQEHAPQKTKRREKDKPNWDRDRADRQWQEAVVNAAIEKEQAEHKYVAPERGAGAGSRKREWPIVPPTPEPVRTSPAHRFDDAARATVTPIQQAAAERAQQRAERREAMLADKGEPPKTRARSFAKDKIGHTLKLGKVAGRTVSKTLDALSDAFDSLVSPKLTPEQISAGEKARYSRDDDADNTIDFARHIADKAERQRQWEDEREAARRHERERGDRDL